MVSYFTYAAVLSCYIVFTFLFSRLLFNMTYNVFSGLGSYNDTKILSFDDKEMIIDKCSYNLHYNKFLLLQGLSLEEP